MALQFYTTLHNLKTKPVYFGELQVEIVWVCQTEKYLYVITLTGQTNLTTEAEKVVIKAAAAVFVTTGKNKRCL